MSYGHTKKYLPQDVMESEGDAEVMNITESIDRLQALHCESQVESEDYEAIQVVVGELLDMRQVPTLHKRKCWPCGNVAYHADARMPYVKCRRCGSQDTRLLKELKEMPKP